MKAPRAIPYRRRSAESRIEPPFRLNPPVKRKAMLHELDAAPVVLLEEEDDAPPHPAVSHNAPPRWWDRKLDRGLKRVQGQPGADVPGARPRSSKVAIPKREGGPF